VTPAVVLSVAGSDPGGGAGLQADLRTFAALGVHGASALCALTVQDTTGVSALHPVEPAVVADQIDAVVGDLAVLATKTGMLGRPDTASVVTARRARLGALVVDPVLRASTGDSLAPTGMVEAYRKVLIPVATVVCPNLDEASVLCGMPVADVSAMEDAAVALVAMGASAAVVTGGHLEGEVVVDVFADRSGATALRRPRVATINDHGTGCTFSAALAAYLALGHCPVDAAGAAGRFVARALTGAAHWHLGRGRGPLDQLGWDAEAG